MPEIAEISPQSAWNSKLWYPKDNVTAKAIYIDKIPSYDEVFNNILLKNQLCIIGPDATSEWPCRRLWVTPEGSPNFDYISDNFGEFIQLIVIVISVTSYLEKKTYFLL